MYIQWRSNLLFCYAVFVLFFIHIDHQRAQAVFACAYSTLLFNSLLIFFSSSRSWPWVYVSKPMVKYFSSLSLTSPFILIIDRGQQFFALSLTRKRAVRTTLRNLYFVFQNINRLHLAFFFLTAAGDYSTLNAIRRDGEYIRLIAAKLLAKTKKWKCIPWAIWANI